MLHHQAPEDVRAAWSIDDARTIEPRAGVDRDGVREAYAELRDSGID